MLFVQQPQPELYEQILEARNDPFEDLHIVEGDDEFRFQFTMQCSEKDRKAPGVQLSNSANVIVNLKT